MILFLKGHVVCRCFVRLLGLVSLVYMLASCSVDCGWDATAEAWLDKNGNGESDPGESPLANVVFRVDDTLNGDRDVGDYAVSDLQGRANLSVWMPGCPRVELEVHAEAPAPYRPTTADRIKVDLGEQAAHLRFGFTYRPGVPTPVPTPPASITCWTFELKETPDWAYGQAVTDIVAAPDGTIWAAVSGQGIFQLDPVNGNVSAYTSGNGLPGWVVRSIAVGHDGAIWAGTNQGVARLFDGRWTSHTFGSGRAVDEVEGIAVAPNGTVWFAGESGIASYDPRSGSWQQDIVGRDELSSDYQIEGVDASPDGSLWFASYDSLYQLKPSGEPGGGGEWLVHKHGQDHLLGGVSNLQAQDLLWDQALWLIGGSEQGPSIVRYDPATGIATTYNRVTTSGAMFGDILTSLASGHDGSLWIGMASNGVQHFYPGASDATSGTWIHYTTENGLPDDHIYAVAVDPQGIVWLGSDRFSLHRCLVGQ
jgi:streptogramin lyase